MRRFIFLLVALGIIVGSSYALFPGLFPDTATFPRVPTGSGTIGALLEKILGTNDLENYSGDGTVPDSAKLDGVGSSGYLRDDPPCGAGQKYVGIKSNGRRDCAATSTLLTDYGRIDSQWCAASYYRADGTNGTTSTGDTLKAGDIVKTAPGCPMNIVFADYSILRLDGDSTVSLDVGSLSDGTSIASAILSNGSLWWRILTETGSYSIGTETVVAWVRGTSLLLTRASPAPTITSSGGSWHLSPNYSSANLTIVHTTLPGGVAGTGTCRDDSLGDIYFPLRVWANNIIPATSCSIFLNPTPPVALDTDDVYTATPLIADYTRADLEYMKELTVTSSLPSTKIARINNELSVSLPITTSEKNALCSGSGTFWDALLETDRTTCQVSTLRAFADYTTGIGPIYTQSGPLIQPTIESSMSGLSMPHVTYNSPPIIELTSWNWTGSLQININNITTTQSLIGFYAGSTSVFRIAIAWGSLTLFWSGTSTLFTWVTWPQDLVIEKLGTNVSVTYNSTTRTVPIISTPINTIYIGKSSLNTALWLWTISLFNIKK
jgi:hypothetical protein